MSIYKILIDSDALQDIQNASDWYDEQLPGLGVHYQKQVKTKINSSKKTAKLYALRYAAVRCSYVKGFPFLIHYTINEKQKTVEVFAVLHTSRSPKIWSQR